MTLADYSIIYRAKDMLSDGLKGIVAKSEAAAAQAGQAADRLGAKVKGFGAANMEVFAGIAEGVPGLSGALGTLANPYVAAGLAVTALGTASYQAAAEWEKGMAKVNVTAQMSKAELAKVSDQVLAIASRSSSDFGTVPEAFNKIISAGLNVNDALKTLEPTLMAAKAGFADVETTAAAAVATMNSSGINDATKVYDILFATLNKGNVEFNDIAQYLPKVMVGARAAGHSLEEVGGGFAVLTANGFSADQAATGLMNVFKALSDSDIIHGSKKYKGLEGIGVAVYVKTEN